MFLHDFLYRNTEESKEYCDDVLLEAMQWLIEHDADNLNEIENAERRIKAKIIYDGVHLAGWASFDGDRKDKEQANLNGGE